MDRTCDKDTGTDSVRMDDNYRVRTNWQCHVTELELVVVSYDRVRTGGSVP